MEETQNTATESLDSNVATGRVYELATLFVPSFDEEKVSALFGDLKNFLETKGASLIADDSPKLIDLAYEMSRTIANKKTWFEDAYFSWIKFEAEAASVKEINDVLLRDESIIRFMIVKTVKENTVFSKKAYTKNRRDGFKTEGSLESEVKEPLSEQEVDKEIDAMLEA